MFKVNAYMSGNEKFISQGRCRVSRSFLKLTVCVVSTAFLCAQAVAGHSGPRREAGKLLAVAETFTQRCADFGAVDENVLRDRLHGLGVRSLNPDEQSGVGAYRAEYLDEFETAIRQEGIEAFCDAALEAFATGDVKILTK